MSKIQTKSVLPVEEDFNLIKQFRNGDKAAADKLINVYKGFVEAVAKKYQNRGLAMSELITAGTEGLIKAAAKYDESRGYRFISYAVWWVRQSILQALAH